MQRMSESISPIESKTGTFDDQGEMGLDIEEGLGAGEGEASRILPQRGRKGEPR